MARSTVQVKGARELRRSLKKAEGDLNAMKDAHEKVSRMVAALAQASAPKRSGRLASSIRGTRQQSRAVVKAGGRKAPYAVFVHWGTTTMTANPWVSAAAQGSEPRWLPIYKADVDKALERVKGA